MYKGFKYILILFFSFLLTVNSYSQFDTAMVAHRAKHVSHFNAKTIEKLSTTLAKDCSSDEETVFAFAYWICKNLRFDYSAYEKRPAENKTIKKVLHSRKALSDGYTKLFVELCNQQKIPAIYVPGYIKDYDFIAGDTLYRAEYAWALVSLSDGWYIMDLTAASSKVVAVANPMSKVLWKIFRIPYSTHLKAVKEYSPQYLYASPQTTVTRIVPVADMFQLLQYPLPLSYYTMSDSLMKVYLLQYPEKKTNFDDLQYFYQLPQNKKNILLADESEIQNPFNQYTKALYYYYVVKNFFNTYYIPEKGKIFAPLEESEKAYKYLKTSDSLFQIATKNNEKELLSKQNRSEYWRVNLLESNKILSSRLSLQSKVNNQQMRTIGKVTSQNKKTQAYLSKYKNKYALRDIVDLERPQIQNKEYLEEGKDLLDDAKESMIKCTSLLHDYDSLLADLRKDKIDEVYVQQQSASKLCNDELASLSRYLDKKESNLSLVYYSDKYVFKRSYLLMFEKVGNINEAYTDPLVDLMFDRSTQLYPVIQSYINETINTLKLLKAAKVFLVNDFGEDDMYEKIALNFNKQLDVFTKDLDEMNNFNSKLTTCLTDDVTMYNDIVKMLQNDNSIENSRHKEYMEYRKSIKQAENDKIRYYQETMKGYQKLIVKAINGK